jgi:glycosyltransferase involved in cell wall biosynthesis
MAVTGYLAGTLIQTTSGPVPVEALVENELVLAASGEIMPVIWLGKRRLNLARHPNADSIRPIRVGRGALARGVPSRDLYVGPDHLLLVDEMAVPAASLVNGASICMAEHADGTDQITFFEVELAANVILRAEDAPVYSYRDLGERMLFANAADTGKWQVSRAQSPQHGVPQEIALLRAVRDRLLRRAAEVGFAVTEDPDLRLGLDGKTFLPDRDDDGYHFSLPPGTEAFHLRSRTFVPTELRPDAGDGRRLGVALAEIRLEGGGTSSTIDLRDPAHFGVHLPERNGERCYCWTNGDAVLQCPPSAHPMAVTVQLAYVGSYWQRTDTGPWDAPRSGSSAGRMMLISGEPETPGHTYRVVHMAEAARALGMDVRCLRLADIAGNLEQICTADVLVIWRAPLDGPIQLAVDAARQASAPVVLDIDDLMIDPRLARVDVIDAMRLVSDDDAAGVKQLYTGILDTLISAKACWCTTEELAIHARREQRATFVLPNGYDRAGLRASRRAVRLRRMKGPEDVIRIGYAGGTRTHQQDFAVVVRALTRLLRERSDCRLVLFRRAEDELPLVDVDEYPGLSKYAAQIEWRDMVDLAGLPAEIARFDINLAPLSVGNIFCEAKSELKFFEAALAGVCTVASPTGPFRRAIRNGETGFLAATPQEWYATLRRLVNDGPLRRRTAVAACHDVLWTYGPERRVELLASALAQLAPGREAARVFELDVRRAGAERPPLPRVPDHAVVHYADAMHDAEVTVIIPVYNYADLVKEALDSVWHQTVPVLDLVVIDDRSTDESLAVIMQWVMQNGQRFNRVVVLQNLVNSGLGLTRNVGFAAAETPYVLPLDADNRLFPHCVSFCTNTIKQSGCAYAYPTIQQFGDATELLSPGPYSPAGFAGGNYIDAMALIAKSAWAGVGGYDHVRYGWEDYDFWCRMAEVGLWGEHVDMVLAEYRVHSASMLRTTTEVAANKRRLVADMQRRHPWTAVRSIEAAEAWIKKLDNRTVGRRGRAEQKARRVTPEPQQQVPVREPARRRRPTHADET